jgi:predicted metalloprotease with PDZ domain
MKCSFRKHCKIGLTALLLFMTLTTFAQHKADIKFEISFIEPQAHYIEVKMNLDNLKEKEIEVALPVWAPGSYLVREFSKNIESIQAVSKNGNPLSIEKSSKNSWKIKTDGDQTISISYRIYAFEISVRTSFVDASHAFLSPTGVFLHRKGYLNQPAIVEIKPFKSWSKVSTGLEKIDKKSFTYYAKNFDWLYDSPIEIGNQDIFEFEVEGVKHEVAMVGEGNYDKAKLKDDMTKVIVESTGIFKENPNDRYVFIVHHYLNGGGGLEHLNSTVLGAKRNAYSNSITYSNFLSLVAHEYFHLWNVKRLRPIALGPFDYDKENYTTDLWIAEGFTAYYDNLLIKRAGIIDEDRYFQLLQIDINSILNSNGDKVQSVAEASFDAWIKYYRQNENSTNSQVSYYTKGAVLGAVLDLWIIKNSEGKRSLDDVLRDMYIKFYKEKDKGYTSDEFKLALEQALGESLNEFYKKYVHGTEAIDFNKFLNYAGLELVETSDTRKPSLGIKEKKGIITHVLRNGGAWEGGLNVNDELIAINGERVIDLDLSSYKIGDKVDVLINRDGILKTISIKLGPISEKSWRISHLSETNDQQKEVFKKWLK